MEASSELTLEKAAEHVAQQAKLVRLLGPVTVDTRVKFAFSQPKSIAQGLQYLMTPPTVANGSGIGVHTDPVWGTAQKALLGAGLGAGGMGLAAAFDKKRRKHWLRNMMMGGVLGGGIGGGLGAVYHSAQAAQGGAPSTAAIDRYTKAKQKIEEAVQSGGVPDNELYAEQAAAKAELPGESNGYISPFWDRVNYAYNKMDEGIPGWLDGANIMTPHKAEGVAGGLVGGAVGAGVGQYRTAAHETATTDYQNAKQRYDANVADQKSLTQAERIKNMPDASLQAQFGSNWQQMKKVLADAEPGIKKSPVTFQDVFPNIAPEHQMGPAEYHKLTQRANQLPDAPTIPKKPHLGARSLGGIGAAAGALLPQIPVPFVNTAAPPEPTKPPASAY